MTEARAFALRLAPVSAEIMAEGHTSVRAVTGALNARGVPSREGGRWHLRSTHALLKRLPTATKHSYNEDMDGELTFGDLLNLVEEAV